MSETSSNTKKNVTWGPGTKLHDGNRSVHYDNVNREKHPKSTAIKKGIKLTPSHYLLRSL